MAAFVASQEEGKGKAKPALEKKKKPMFLLYKLMI